MSLISGLQRRYAETGDQLAHDAETVIGELCAALRKIADYDSETNYSIDALAPICQIARDALRKCAEGI